MSMCRKHTVDMCAKNTKDRQPAGALAALLSSPSHPQEYIMSIGIIGAGALGSSIARLLAKNGIAATIANRRGPQSLAVLVQELGPAITAGTVEEAASAEIVFVALRWADAK